jgi:hypothetical protein
MKSFEMLQQPESEQSRLISEMKDGVAKIGEARKYFNGLINDLPNRTDRAVRTSEEYAEALAYAKKAAQELKDIEESFEAYRRWLGEG